MNPLETESEVAPAEDAVKALLEYFVDPMLPLKPSSPSLSQHQSLAKQVHAVVLLYNYYQRKHHPEVEFLGFESFCKLAVTLKPSLMPYMKLMHRHDNVESADQENQLSVTERAITDACTLSSVLDALKDVPSIEGWPISKVGVLLIDSGKENCMLRFSSVTHGVWSVIEKDLDVCGINSESTMVEKHINKRKRVDKKSLMKEHGADEAGFQHFAFSAVKEATGIDQADLMVLESRVVYSLSKQKTAACFYIMQSTPSINEDFRVPIKDVIESLQGPLVKKEFGSWTVTPVVEYFHVLPYAGIMSDLFSRKVFPNNFQDLRVGLGSVDVNILQSEENTREKEVSERKEVSSNTMQNTKVKFGSVNVRSFQRTENPSYKEVTLNMGRSDNNCSIAQSTGNGENGVKTIPQRTENPPIKEFSESRDSSKKKEANGANTESPKQKYTNGYSSIGLFSSPNGTHDMNVDDNTLSPKQKDINGCGTIGLVSSSNGPYNLDVDGTLVVCPKEGDESENTHMTGKIYHCQEKRTSTESDINALTCSVKLKAEVDKVNAGKKTCSTSSSDQDGMPDTSRIPFQLNAKYTERGLSTLAEKEVSLSQTALRVLFRKREKLSHQLRSLEDEIATCDKNIKTILDGGEGNKALNIEVILDFCNDVCLQGEAQDRIYQHVEDQGPHQYVKGKGLSEAILTLRSLCQELDDICKENNWMLPTYRVRPSDDGYMASVIVKGKDFECSGGSDLRPSAREARESAASKMIAKIWSMASQKH